jgi:hypothetical protein
MISKIIISFLVWVSVPATAAGDMGDLDQAVRECVMLKYTQREDGNDRRFPMKYEDINEMKFTFTQPGCQWTVTGHARVPGAVTAYTQWWVCVNRENNTGFRATFITHKRLYLN